MDITNLRANKEKYDILSGLNIDEIIAESDKFECMYYSSIFKSLQKDFVDKNEYSLSSAYLLLYDVTSMALECRTTILDDFNNDDIEIFKVLTNKISNTTLKARLSDVLWQRTRHNQWAEIAIDSYFEYSQELINTEHGFLVYKPIERSLLIAKKIKSQSKIDKIVTFIELWITNNNENVKSFLVDSFAKLLLHIKEGNFDKIVEVLINLANLSENNSDFLRAVQRWDIVSSLWLQLNNSEQKKLADLKAVTVLRKESKHYQSCGDSFNATTPLSQAYQRLKLIGGAEQLRKEVNDELVTLQVDAKNYMQTFSHEIDISKIVNQSISFVKGKAKKDALISFALSIKTNIVGNLKDEVKKNINEFPLLNLFEQSVIDERGRTIAKIPGINFNNDNFESDVLIPKMIQTACQNISFIISGSISPMLKIIMDEHYIDQNTLREILNNNPIVPEDRIEIMTKGFYHCFKNDFVIGMSLLIPQVENLIRFILETHGYNTSTFNKNGEIQEEMMIKELVHKFLEQLNQILGEDLTFEFNHVFNERLSFNIRNEFAHGKMNYQNFNSTGCIYGFWLLWKLCVLGHLIINNKNNDDNNLGN
jgi:hypothetical protein